MRTPLSTPLAGLRRNVLSVFAVMVALAVGIALGTGPLQRSGRAAPTAATSRHETLTSAHTRGKADQQALSFSDAYAAATAGRVLGAGLKNRAVTVLSLPGADPGSVSTLASLVQRAGGRVATRVALSKALLDAGKRQLVTELAGQTGQAARTHHLPLPSGVTGYDEMALLLAHALVTTSTSGASLDSTAQNILASVAAAGLAKVQVPAPRRGSLVLAVGGAPYGSADQRAGTGDILGTLLTVLDSHSDGVVLTGPVSAGAADGVVGQVAADPQAASRISTVDVGDRVAGAVVAILAAERQANGGVGHYGSSAAKNGPLPAGIG